MSIYISGNSEHIAQLKTLKTSISEVEERCNELHVIANWINQYTDKIVQAEDELRRRYKRMTDLQLKQEARKCAIVRVNKDNFECHTCMPLVILIILSIII